MAGVVALRPLVVAAFLVLALAAVVVQKRARIAAEQAGARAEQQRLSLLLETTLIRSEKPVKPGWFAKVWERLKRAAEIRADDDLLRGCARSISLRARLSRAHRVHLLRDRRLCLGRHQEHGILAMLSYGFALAAAVCNRTSPPAYLFPNDLKVSVSTQRPDPAGVREARR